LASVVVTNLAAQFADNLISRGVETTTVRKYVNIFLDELFQLGLGDILLYM